MEHGDKPHHVCNRYKEDDELDEDGNDVASLLSDEESSESDKESVTDADSIASDRQEAPPEGHYDYSDNDARDSGGRLQESTDAKRGTVAAKIGPIIKSEPTEGGETKGNEPATEEPEHNDADELAEPQHTDGPGED